MISDGARLHQKLPKNCFFGCYQPRLLVSSMCLLEIRMHFSKACKHQVSNSCFFKSRTKMTFVDWKSTADLGDCSTFSFAWNDSKKFSRVNMCWPVAWIKTIAVLGDQWHVFLKGSRGSIVKWNILIWRDVMRWILPALPAEVTVEPESPSAAR